MTNAKPLVSVIVPVYNGEKYISECIESIINQDYDNIELIVVNDGSTDSSLNILENFASKDKRIRIISKENGGVSLARNEAIRNMQGKYFCLVDQDDCIAPDYVSYFLRLIRENNTEIAIVPQARRFMGKKPEKTLDEKDFIEVWSGNKAVCEMLYYNIIIAPWNKMISTDLIKRNNITFDKNYFSGEGFLFSIECFQRADSVAVGHKRVYYYRCDNTESAMTKFKIDIVRSSIDAQKMIRKKLINNSGKMMRALGYANWHTHCDMYSYMKGCNAECEHKEIYKKIKRVCKKDSVYAIDAPITGKEKLKALIYGISPNSAVWLINKFRMRKYTQTK